MWQEEHSSTYGYSNNYESVKKFEESLSAEFANLKREIETNDMINGLEFIRPFTSVPQPIDPQMASLERKVYIEKILKVPGPKKLYIQADIIMDQYQSLLREEYTNESLPLILHQFFADKISWLVHAKHAHLLRWKRFAENSNFVEDLYVDLKNRLGYILSDYNDSIQRVKRLTSAREQLLLANNCSQAMSSVQKEDVSIYLRWLASYFYSQKSFQQCIKILEWLPHQMSTEFLAQHIENKKTADQNKKNSIKRSFENRSNNQSSDQTSFLNNKNSLLSSYLNMKFKALDNIYLSSTNALVPRDEILNSISYTLNQDEIPVHTNSTGFLIPRLRYLMSFYKIDYNLQRMQTPGDEMELFSAVSRKFREIFNMQEQMKTFRVYDTIDSADKWDNALPQNAYKKESNWIEFIQIRNNKDAIYENEIAKLKERNFLDQFLLPHSNFIEISSDERVQEALRENAMLSKTKQNIEPVSVTTNVTMFNTNALWKKVFHNPNLNFSKSSMGLNGVDLDRNQAADEASKTITFRNKTISKKIDDFNFTENLQKLGLDDSKSSNHNLTNVQGSYLSYLMLRHLRIRDLKRQALSFLNYFRSIEKVLTIYDGGLSLEHKKLKRQGGQNHEKETPFGENLGYHAYMYNTPKDFKISETEFMDYNEIENHDDYYSHDEKDFIHVRDQRGFYIIYDVAIHDLKVLEEELHLIASYYIAKEREINEANSKTRSDQNFSIIEYAHQNVDRFGILLDIWTNEVNFLEMKKNLISLYLEVYQNVFDKNEKRKLAQIMTNIIYQRARLDLSSNYFTQSYRYEVSCVSKQVSIVKIILNKMIDDMRSLTERISMDNKQYGLPYSLIKKYLICLSPNKEGTTMKNLYMLEFHPFLSSINRIPEALQAAIEEIIYFQSSNTVNERLNIEQAFLAHYLTNLQTLNPSGHSFTPQIQKDVFNCPLVEDPSLISELFEGSLNHVEEIHKSSSKKEKAEAILKASCKVLETVTLRHRLIIATLETEVLSNIYKKQCNEMGFEDFHLFLRYIEFDIAKYKDNPGQSVPIFVNEMNSEDSQIDRYVSNALLLAAQEIDETHIGRISFRTKESIQNMIIKQDGLENFQIIVKLQIVHNNALKSAIMQSNSCFLSINLTERKQPDTLMLTSLSNMNNELASGSMKYSEYDSKVFSGKRPIKSAKTHVSDNEGCPLKKYNESFTSLQLEKNAHREVMFNNYIRTREKKSQILQNPVEMEKLKRQLINEYANNYNDRVVHNSLRSQLIVLFYSIAKLLESFPATRDNHFIFGEPHETRQFTKLTESGNLAEIPVTEDNVDYIKPDARTFKRRPRKILSDDGERVLNIWFIPHYTEILSMYKKRSDTFCIKTLRLCVRIIGAINDILHFIKACACMQIAVTHGNSNDLTTASIRRKIDFTSWENAGGLDIELSDIQLEINQLDDPCDPEQVADLLEAKRGSLFLQYECAIRFAVRNIFLANGSIDAYNLITENMHFALRFFNEIPQDTTENSLVSLPEPLDSLDPYANLYMPWRAFISKHGPFQMHYWPWYLIERNITLCVNGLMDSYKHVANGEILGVSLMMEDLLNCSTCSSIFEKHEQNEFDLSCSMSCDASKFAKLKSKKSKLIQNYKQWQFFLMTWKRCEILKLDWGRRKVGVENINNTEIYNRFNENYRKDILLPVLKVLVKSPEIKEMYDNIVDFKQPILLPPDASELDSKAKQIARLLEKLELFMIDETIQRVQKDIKLVLSERCREENTLTTDLWKKSIMKEEFTINKPQLANEFSCNLYEILEPDSSKSLKQLDAEMVYNVKEKDLKVVLNELGNRIQERERSNFEQYTLLYENLLRQQHGILYRREREILVLKNQLEKQQATINVEVQTQMADVCYDLIMEVTALRAKMNETADKKISIEKEVREKIKGEFIDLINDLVNVNTNLKSQLDTYKEEIHENCLALIAEIRTQAFAKANDLKTNLGFKVDELAKETQLNQQNMIYQLQEERDELYQVIIKQKSFAKLSTYQRSKKYTKKINGITEETDLVKKKSVNNALHSEEKQILIKQQNIALRKQLATLDVEFSNLKNKLDKELKEKSTREYELQQKIKNEKNLNAAKTNNVERLFEELEEKDIELRQLYLKTDKTSKMQSLSDSKIQKELNVLKKNLAQERHFKLDAFQKVDELQSHLYDLEDELTNNPINSDRPQSSSVAKIHPNRAKSSFGLTLKRSNSSNGVTNSVNNVPNTNQATRQGSAFPRLIGSNSSIQSDKQQQPLQTAVLNSKNKTVVSSIKLGEINEFGEIENGSRTPYRETITRLIENFHKNLKQSAKS